MSMTNQEAADQVVAGYRLPKPDLCPEEIYKIMERCWDKVADIRPSFSDLQKQFTLLSPKTATKERVVRDTSSNYN